MRTCMKCGFFVEDSERFCRKCGNPSFSANRSCPSCGASIDSSYRFCLTCGAPVASAPIALRPVPSQVPTPAPAPVQQPQYRQTSQYQQFQPTAMQPSNYRSTAPVPPAAAHSTTGSPRYSPLNFIMYGVSFIYILAAFFPTYEINIPLYGKVEGNISIFNAVRLGDLDLDLQFVKWFHIFCFLFFIAAIAMNILSLISVIRRKNRSFWLTMALSGIFSFVGLLIWVIEWTLILAVLRSNYITGLLAMAINPTFYLYLAQIASLFMIIFGFIQRHRSHNY